jgi:hypothetical protein
MNKQAVFAFIRKNLLSLICALVALIALVATFYPIGGWIDDLQSQARDRSQADAALDAFKSKPRKLPLTDMTKPDADPGTLTVFPNSQVVAAGQNINTKIAAESKAILDYVKKLNADGHPQLVPGVLPNQQSQPVLIAFANVYPLVLSPDPSVTGLGDKPNPILATYKALNLQNDILKGRLPPLKQEIDEAKNALYTKEFDPQIYFRNGVAVNREEVLQKYNIAAAKLPQQLKYNAAVHQKMYVEPTAFETNQAINPNSTPALAYVWYAQLALWIQQDIARSIAEANASATNVLDAPVKHLIWLRIDPMPMYTFPPATNGGAGPSGASGMPSTATETQPIPLSYTVSPTGRSSNGMYDVVQFHLLIDVDAKRVNDVIQTFSHNRLITIFNQNMWVLDTAREESAGYLYGDGRVVRLRLDGESLFLRSWTTPWMPDAIKIALGLMANPGGPQTPTGGRPGMPPGGFMPPGGPMGIPPQMR